ncbi:thymidylate synthase [Pectobacterium phage vB_PatP_CB4]|uniref:Thymidylate synthase n=1 Tax=Pectobacterium phage vB_PatP_CB4 TaxID=1958919 RepID=A0A2P0N9U1_9CAUD|nr:thymidylate synthase [Pectobacterium phage vB_PatP_CB4]AQT27909.1 thymidylate synthase [Pectobacterium phage vB_PatP_CB4]
MSVKLISITPDAESMMGYIARVSNPANQDNPDVAGLLSYCIKHNHWSVFEQAHMTIEIETARAISTQILRHRSFTFQEFSQRYAEVAPAVMFDLRSQDTKNRQNSIDDIPQDTQDDLKSQVSAYLTEGHKLYQSLVTQGVAKECARMMLPMCSPTCIYMTGNIRSWITYINLRSANGTQKEHMDIAEECKKVFKEQLPTLAIALNW